MRIIVANCEIYYTGRGKTFLPEGERLILIKDDGTVLIHKYSGLRPANYMKESIKIVDELGETSGVLRVFSKSEQLEIVVKNIISDMELPELKDDASIVVENTELQLHNWLARKKNFEWNFSSDAKYLDQEFNTMQGSCDLIGVMNERLMLIEVKRTACKFDVYQVIRYANGVKELFDKMVRENIDSVETRNGKKVLRECLEEPLLYLVANEVKPGVVDYAEKYNIYAIELSNPAN